MKVQKKSILSIFFSIFFSIIIFIISYMNNSLIMSLEISILFLYFFNIITIYKDRFNPFAFVMISFLLGILDVILVASNIRIINSLHTIDIYEKALFIIILWLICFSIPLLINYSKQKTLNKKKNIINYVLENTNIKTVLIIFTIIYFYVIYKVIKTIMIIGIDAAMINSAVFRYDNQGYLATLISISSIVPICLLELNKNKLAYLSGIIMFIILLLTGRRGLIISSLIFPFIIYYNYRRKKITNKKLILIGIFCLILIFLIGSLRGQQEYNTSSNKYFSFLTNLTISTQLGENLPDTIYAIDSERVQYSKFKYLGNGLIGIIPRKIWKNKPELIDHSMIISSEIYNISEYGRPVGTYGFSYFCFGIPGVIISAFITGFLTKKFYYWMLKQQNCISIFLYSILINYVINIIKPESVMNIITVFIIILIAAFIGEIIKLTKKGR